MSDLQEIIEKEFNRLKSKEYASETDSQNLMGDLRAELDFYKTLYLNLEQAYEGLREIVFVALLNHKLKLSDISQEVRVCEEGLTNTYYTAAHRYAYECRKSQVAIEVLSMMYDDVTWATSTGQIDQKIYNERIKEWLKYLDFDIMWFKGDQDFECYFQEQKEANRDLFETYGM